MNFTGVIVNTLGVFAGSILGSLIGDRIPKRVRQTIIAGVALCVFFIGVDGITLGGTMIIAILSIVIGAILGELINFDQHLNNLGNKLQAKFASGGGNLAEGFITSTLLFCTGAMAIVGSLESGMLGSPDTLLAKSILDTVTVTILASYMGIGTAFSGISLLLYQGGITLLAGSLAPYMTQPLITEISFVGSILILGLSLNMLELTEIRIGNLILAPFIPILLYPLLG